MKNYVGYHYITFDRWENVKHHTIQLLIHKGSKAHFVKYKGQFRAVHYIENIPYLSGDWYQENVF